MPAGREPFTVSPWAWTLCAAFALLVVVINPVGYFGGRSDDWHYLEAAHCWAMSGKFCLPVNHWETRWPAFAPIAMATSWFGETRVVVGLAALPAWVSAIVLIGWLGRLWVDRVTGLVAAAVLTATPVFAQAALQPGVDTVELAMQLAALLTATIAYQGQRRGLAFFAGMLAALAVQARDTSFLFCMASAVAWLALDRDRRKILLWAIPGVGMPLLVEFAAYWASTGDALFRYHLALGHGTIPSEELPRQFDTSQNPLFNRAYIANWRREMGIVWWWPIDPWLNLLASPRIGFTFIGAMLLGGGCWGLLAKPVRRLFAFAIALVVMAAVLLVYGLGIDPKPRMFMLAASVASLFIGATISASIRLRRGAVPLVMLGLILALGVFTLTRLNSTSIFEEQAKRWMREHPGNLSLDPSVLSTIALAPGVRTLPSAAGRRDYRISGGNARCETYAGRVADRSAIVGGGQLCLMDVR